MQESSKEKKGTFLRYFLDTKYLVANIIAATIAAVLAAWLISKPAIGTSKESPQNINPIGQARHTDSLNGQQQTSKASSGTDKNKSPQSSVVLKTRATTDAITKCDVVVVALNNDKPDGPMAMALSKWISNMPTARSFSIRQASATRNDLDRLSNGEAPDFSRIRPSVIARYFCLLHCTVSYEDSRINPALIVANGKYELSIVEPGTRKMLYTKETPISAAEIDQDLARQKIDSLYIDELRGQTVLF